MTLIEISVEVGKLPNHFIYSVVAIFLSRQKYTKIKSNKIYSTVPNLIICYQLGENEKREYITITTKNSASSYMMHGAK